MQRGAALQEIESMLPVEQGERQEARRQMFKREDLSGRRDDQRSVYLTRARLTLSPGLLLAVQTQFVNWHI